MTTPFDTIPALVAEQLADLFAASAMIHCQLPGFIAARLPEAARLCDADILADRYGKDPSIIAGFLGRLDVKTEPWLGCQPFRTGDLLTFVSAFEGPHERDRVATMLGELKIYRVEEPALRITRVMAAADLVVKIRSLDMESGSLAGASALVLRHALLRVGIGVPIVPALMTLSATISVERLLAACLTETQRIGKVLTPTTQISALLKRAAQEVPELLPVINILLREPLVPRGEVAGLLGLPERSARRRISALIEMGWAGSETPKGPLRADVPAKVLANIMAGQVSMKDAK
jgi:hypothetical protein